MERIVSKLIEPPEEQVVAGKIAAGAIRLAMELCQDCIDGKRLDLEIEAFIKDQGAIPALKGYRPQFSLKPYKWTICLARDKEVVHGLPIKMLAPNDIITVDLVVGYKGWHADTARTFTYSKDKDKQRFVQTSAQIYRGSLAAVEPNCPISDYGNMVEAAANIFKYGVVKEFCGHRIGQSIHMDPQIQNYSQHDHDRGIFQPGKSYAVEPVLVNKPSYTLKHSQDGWTVIADTWASHNEDTIFITDSGKINLTK